MNKKYENAIFRQDDSKGTVNHNKEKILYNFSGKIIKSTTKDKEVACYSEGNKRYVCVNVDNILVDPHKKHNQAEDIKTRKKKQNHKSKLIEVEVVCFDYYLHYLQTQTEAFFRMAQQKIKNHRGGRGVVANAENPFDKMTPKQLKNLGIHKLA